MHIHDCQTLGLTKWKYSFRDLPIEAMLSHFDVIVNISSVRLSKYAFFIFPGIHLILITQIADNQCPTGKCDQTLNKSATFLNNKTSSAIRSPGRVSEKIDWAKKEHQHHRMTYKQHNRWTSWQTGRGTSCFIEQ